MCYMLRAKVRSTVWMTDVEDVLVRKRVGDLQSHLQLPDGIRRFQLNYPDVPPGNALLVDDSVQKHACLTLATLSRGRKLEGRPDYPSASLQLPQMSCDGPR
jgi:hypothetical protein